jgi:hypothetical protein
MDEEFKLQRKTHNKIILDLQKQYEEEVNISYVWHMLPTLKEMATNFINKEIREKGFFLTKEDIDCKALVAADYVIKQFVTRAKFRLSNPSAYVYLRVKKALYEKIDACDDAFDIESMTGAYIDYNDMTEIEFYKKVLLMLKYVEIDDLSYVRDITDVCLEVRYTDHLGLTDKLIVSTVPNRTNKS